MIIDETVVEIVPAVPAVLEKRVVLNLSVEEAQILAATIFFPDWAEQPETVRDFLSNAWSALEKKLDLSYPDELGMVDKVSF